MTIERTESGFVATGRASVDSVMLLAAKGRLLLEIDGLRFKGPSISKQLKARFGWKGNKRQLIQLLEEELHDRLTPEGGVEERAYAAVTDELNDGTPNQLTLEDLDPEYVRKAKNFATLNNFPWPPQTGDFDRFYEWRNQRQGGRYL